MGTKSEARRAAMAVDRGVARLALLVEWTVPAGKSVMSRPAVADVGVLDLCGRCHGSGMHTNQPARRSQVCGMCGGRGWVAEGGAR